MDKNTQIPGAELFNLNSYNALVEAAAKAAKSGDEDAIEDVALIKKATDSWHGYVTTVDMTETRIKVARFRCEGEEYREVVAEADRARRNVHEAAIANAAMINRVARAYGIREKIYCGDINDRYQVADFCLAVTVSLFDEARNAQH